MIKKIIMIKQDYSYDNDNKILDIEYVKNKRNQFFEPSSRIRNDKADLTIGKRKNQRSETFIKKRKMQLNSLLKEGKNLDIGKIEKSKLSLYIKDFLSDKIDDILSGLKHLKKLLLLESTEKIEKQLINKSIVQRIISLAFENHIDLSLECLSFLSIFTSKNAFFDKIFFSNISQLIDSDNTYKNELSLIILSNLLYNLSDSSIYNEIVISQVIQELSWIICQTNSVKLLLPALNSLFNIFISLKGESVIPTYFNSIDSVREYIQINVTLSNIFQTEVEVLSYIYPVLIVLLQIFKDKIIQLYIDKNFVSTALSSLYIPINDSRLVVLRLFYNMITYSNSDFIDVLISHKFIEKLVEFLDSDNKSLQKLTCKILSLLTNTIDKVGYKITEKGILKLIYKNLHNPNQNKEHFLRILNALISNIRDKDLFDRIDLREIVSIIAKLICTRNVSLIDSSLDLLIITLNLEGSFNTTSILIPYSINIGLYSEIEKLAYHQDKSVYERVLKIQNFFNKMTD